MSLELQVDLAAYPKDTELAFNHLGVVENGGTLTIEEDQEAAFVAETGMSVRDAFEGQEGIKVTGKATAKPAEGEESESDEAEPEVAEPEKKEE